MLPKIKKSSHVIYLDHAATTPLDLKVQNAMQPFWSGFYGNPSGLYEKGREADKALANARKVVSNLIGAKPEEIIFTAGGTESINLAIFGIARMNTDYKTEKHGLKSPHLIASTIEHHAVLRSYEELAEEGYQTTFVGVDEQGLIKLDELKKAVRPETILISIMYANNEIGTIEPIAEIGKWLKAENEKRKTQNLPKIFFHTDACQAAGSLDVNVNHLGVDLMTVNGSKTYGPKQTGFLYVKSGTRLKPLIYGGGQEQNIRSGTENVPGIVGLAEALKISQKTREKENSRLRKLRDYFTNKLFQKIPDIILNGPDESKFQIPNSKFQTTRTRLPNNINLTIPGAEGEALLLYLDSYNIAVATGSACATQSQDPSHVLLAIGKSPELAQQTIRITLGKSTTKKQLDYVLKVMPGIVAELRRVGNNDSHDLKESLPKLTIKR